MKGLRIPLLAVPAAPAERLTAPSSEVERFVGPEASGGVALAHQKENRVFCAVVAIAIPRGHRLEGGLHLRGLLGRQRGAVVGKVLQDILLVLPEYPLALLEEMAAQVLEEIREN